VRPHFATEQWSKLTCCRLCFIGGPFVGPLISELLSERITWRANYGVLAGFYALSTLIVIVCGRETLFDRQTLITPKGTQVAALTGLMGYRATGRPSFWRVFKDLASISIRPHIFAVCKSI